MMFHLWCDTCQPLDSQHGSQSLFPHMRVSAEVDLELSAKISLLLFHSFPVSNSDAYISYCRIQWVNEWKH